MRTALLTHVRSHVLGLLFVLVMWSTLVITHRVAAEETREKITVAKPITGRTRLARLLRGNSPANRDELKALQERIRELTPKIIPATVAIQVGRANGSGIIIDEAGHVLTAAHVAGHPGRVASIHLSNGKVARGTTLGMNPQLDAGLIKITDEGPWPFAPLGKSADLKEGQWCLATGHPGGYDPDRPPVLRWGRILKIDESAILTDCTLVGGDSGGPLFDLQGRVIGVHSRIGKNLTINVHVPIDPFQASWDRLVQGEVWGAVADGQGANAEGDTEVSGGWMGVIEDRQADRARVLRAAPGSPAERVGIREGDVIVRVNAVEIRTFADLQREVRTHRAGETLAVEIDRLGERLELQLQLMDRPRPATE